MDFFLKLIDGCPDLAAARHRKGMLEAMERADFARSAGQIGLAEAFDDRAAYHRAELRAMRRTA